jgi:hypothetical protein
MTATFFALAIAEGSTLFLIIAAVWLLSLITYFTPTILTIKKTFFELKDDHLFIKSGRYEKTIPYADIIKVRCGVKSIRMTPFTASFVRTEVRYINQNGVADFANNSPKNEREFVKLLESKITR